MRRLATSILGGVAVFALLCMVCMAAQPPIYELQNQRTTPTGITADIVLTSGSGPYGNDIAHLRLDVSFETRDRVHVKITDATSPRWEVPNVVIDSAKVSTAYPNDDRNYDVSLTASPFSFRITRREDSAVIFDTANFGFVYSNQYISFSSVLPSNPNIYGLGERVHAYRLDPTDKTYTMFAVDRGTTVDRNLYGVHPFYMEYRPSTTAGGVGRSHGVFLLNSNAMDVLLHPSSIEYRTIGGVIDLYFFMGSTSESVVQQYQQVVGKPALFPASIMGYSQCRWGYPTLSAVREVVSNFSHYDLPLDVMWSDIDHMQNYEDFTFDPIRYPVDQVKQFVNELSQKHMHYTVIVDPGIHNRQGYPPYDHGLQQDVFVKEPNADQPLIGQVWPGLTAFPDWFNPATHAYWKNEIAAFLSEVPISYLWIDMNEPANFLDSTCTGPLDAPPYTPGPDPIDQKTLCMSARVFHNQSMYNTHSLYGHMEAIATVDALQQVRGTRPFVLSRSTFAGHGSRAAHWLGDNDSTWAAMAQSVTGMLTMNIFSVPMVGADVCGFNQVTTPELCARWMALGAFYGFYRNHNSIGNPSQEPYALGPMVLNVSRHALLNREAMHPYIYSQFFRAHRDGGTVARAMWQEFPGDQAQVMPLIDTQFMFGSAILVSPVLTQGASSKSTYLPAQSTWFDYWTGARVGAAGPSAGEWVTLPAALPNVAIPVLLRGGYIVPLQDPSLTVWETRQNPFRILVALDASGSASGEMYFDDGESLDTLTAGKYFEAVYYALASSGSGQLRFSVAHTGYTLPASVVYGSIRVSGASCPSGKVTKMTANGSDLTKLATWDVQNAVLSVTGMTFSASQALQIKWSC